MYITQHKYSIERLPEATIGGGELNMPFVSSVSILVILYFSRVKFFKEIAIFHW